VVTDIAAEGRLRSSDPNAAAQVLWTACHGLVALMITRPNVDWAPADELITLLLDGLLHGQPQIRAANPARTRILGNFRSGYKTKPFSCGQYPWWDRLIMKPHIQIECDPAVWNQVESLIRSNLSLEARLPQGSETNSPVSPFK